MQQALAPATPESCSRTLDELAATLSQFESLAHEMGSSSSLVVPSVSGWSVVQHLYHTVLATDLSLGHVQTLLKGSGLLVSPTGSLTPAAAHVLRTRSAQRGVAPAPRMVRPADHVDPDLLSQELSQARERSASLRSRVAEIPQAEAWIPHQLLGPLQAAHWLEFAALHARHHLLIAEDVRAAKT